MSERKAGWYWVKVIDGGKWGCFLWNGNAWEGESDRYSDEMFDVVGPRIPTPDESGRPDNCRNKLQSEGKSYPRSGCAACGNGGLAGCPYER